MAACLPLTANAQWTSDTGHGITIWSGDFTNYGYSVKTNNAGYTFRFTHGVYGEQNGDGSVTTHYPMYIQIYRPDGTAVFDGIEGYELCEEPNISFTMVNQDLAIAEDGSAIISVSDCRLGSSLTYTVYRMNQDGKLLWNGTTLNGGYTSGGSADMTIVPTSDNGAVFTYEAWSQGDESEPAKVMMEKLDKDGNSVWRDSISTSEDNTYPYLVDAGDNQTLLVWAQGTNQNLKCRMLDFDGSSAWGEDVPVYSGGFTSNPLWTMMGVQKAKNGILVYWCDPDYTTGNYENRISYILKDDGSYAFSDGENGTIVSNDNRFSRMQPDVYYDDKEDAIYCAYYVFAQNYQDCQGIYVQKLSAEGELMWGANGEAVEDLPVTDDGYVKTDSLQYLSTPVIRTMGNGNEAVFYLKQTGEYSAYGRVDAYMAIVDQYAENIDKKVILPEDDATKSNLKVSDLLDGDHYIIVWDETAVAGEDEDGKPVYQTNVQAARVNLNGETDKIVTPADKEVAKKLMRQETYSANGARTNGFQPGVNIVKNVYSDGTVSSKKVIK